MLMQVLTNDPTAYAGIWCDKASENVGLTDWFKSWIELLTECEDPLAP